MEVFKNSFIILLFIHIGIDCFAHNFDNQSASEANECSILYISFAPLADTNTYCGDTCISVVSGSFIYLSGNAESKEGECVSFYGLIPYGEHVDLECKSYKSFFKSLYETALFSKINKDGIEREFFYMFGNKDGIKGAIFKYSTDLTDEFYEKQCKKYKQVHFSLKNGDLVEKNYFVVDGLFATYHFNPKDEDGRFLSLYDYDFKLTQNINTAYIPLSISKYAECDYEPFLVPDKYLKK